MLKPIPDGKKRADRNLRRRRVAARLSRTRHLQKTTNNGEINAFAGVWPTNFSKGLPHDEFGIVDARSFRLFVRALNADVRIGTACDRPVLMGRAKFAVPLGPRNASNSYRPLGITTSGVLEFRTVIQVPNAAPEAPKVRNWESPRAGHAYDLQGPDPGALALAPAPALGFDELTAELAELYAMALLRDVSFDVIADGSGVIQVFNNQGEATGPSNAMNPMSVADVLTELHKLAWFDRTRPVTSPVQPPSSLEARRRAARFLDPSATDPLTADELFRGSLPGAKVGPYVSQFLLIGNAARPSNGDPISAAGVAAAASADDAEERSPERQEGSVGAPQPDAGQSRNIGPLVRPFGLEPLRTDQANRGEIGADAALADAALADACDTNGVRDGYIVYGAQRIDQRVAAERPGRDHMTDWRLWLDVQNGADVRGSDAFVDPTLPSTLTSPKTPRFIGTPRDLGTFVHFDQLYQAYLNACILLIADEVDFDTGLPSGVFHSTRGSFATFGVPHILSLLTEVASRALKVVRRQKFNHHLRVRPEALAGVLTLASDTTLTDDEKAAKLGAQAFARAEDMVTALAGTALLDWVVDHNGRQNDNRINDGYFPRLADEVTPGPYTPTRNVLLPMQFPEGSPMHPAYGAGHATVAGACTTIAKAFFELYKIPEEYQTPDMSNPPKRPLDPLSDDYCPPDFSDDAWWATPLTMADLPAPRKSAAEREKIKCVYRAPHGTDDQFQLDPATAPAAGVLGYQPDELTIIGELNKLAANIAIGRNMAGVHYYTDYYDSVRLGERLATGILQEQMLQYPEPVTMRFESFDGDRVIISTDGEGTLDPSGNLTARVRVFTSTGAHIPFYSWWDRDI